MVKVNQNKGVFLFLVKVCFQYICFCLSFVAFGLSELKQ